MLIIILAEMISDEMLDNVLIGPGSKELMFLLQFVYYGDLVIPTPSWVSYAPQARFIGRNVYWVNTTEKNKWLIAAAGFRKSLQARS